MFSPLFGFSPGAPPWGLTVEASCIFALMFLTPVNTLIALDPYCDVVAVSDMANMYHDSRYDSRYFKILSFDKVEQT